MPRFLLNEQTFFSTWEAYPSPKSEPCVFLMVQTLQVHPSHLSQTWAKIMGSGAEVVSVGLESAPATEAQKEQQVDAIKYPR